MENIFIDNTSVPTAIQDELLIHFNSNRKLLKLVDILGREISPKPNHPFFIIYDGGTVEKIIILE